MDSSIDKTYRDKHYAHVWKKPAQPSTTAPTPARPQTPQDNLSTPDLIASFANVPIPQADPIIENTPPPPCPIARAPTDVVVEILKHLAVMDPASFARMALVCKRLAHHFAQEQHIWKRLCQGPEFGFEGMHYTFACDVYGHREHSFNPRYTPFPRGRPVHIPRPLSSWSQVFQLFPRIRFTGIYISTVNYTRPGAASAYQNVSWNSPIHIVTYYRYLRFYPDGSAISLLDTTDPREVVPYISKENLSAARQRQHHRPTTEVPGDGSTDPVPPVAMAAMKRAHRGRWHLGQPMPAANPSETAGNHQAPSLDPRDLIIETEGPDPKYIYTMHLTLRSPSTKPATPYVAQTNPAKNTKLVWRGFWSYNKLTDDWGEFGLRNDRAFVFRRVKGWGVNH